MFSFRRHRSSRSSHRRSRAAFLGRAASRFFPLRLEALEPRLVLDGASLVQDLLPGPDSSHPFIVGNLGDTVFFSAGNAEGTRSLWTVSGSQDPVLLANLDASGNGVELNGALYFGASDGVHGHELWRTDGTAGGTAMVKDIREGQFGSFNGLGFAPLNGELYFSAFHPDYGSELWKTDGTEAGTVLVKDIMPGIGGSEPRWLVATGGLLFFQANDGISGREVWRSDGTEQGTLLTKDVFAGSGNSFQPEELTALGGAVYFRHGNLSTGEELWKTDGTEAGTEIVRDIHSGQTCRPFFCFANHSRPDEITAIGDLLYFSADSATGRELYTSDGTSEGTVLVKDIYPGTDGIEPFRSNPTDFTELGGFVYFFIEHFDHHGQSELWKTDGTEAGTVRVKDLNPLESANAFRLTAIGESLYFVACGDVTTGDDGGDPANCEPWVSDGTEAGTVLHDINPGLANSSPQGDFVAGGGSVFFNADDGEHGAELWRTGIAVQSGTDLEVTISDSPDPALVGELLTYTITVTNHGPEDATGVVILANAPASADFHSVMVPVGAVAVGGSYSFQMQFEPPNEGTFTATASAIGGESDPNLDNNSDSESTLVQKPVPPITIELASATLDVSEGQSEAVLVVTRSGPLDAGTASVEFTTVNGTAGARGIREGLSRVEDFTTTSGTLLFKRGQISREIRIPIRDDVAIEGDETFRVVLSNPSANAQLGPIAATTVTLQDNDPSISFVASSSEKIEPGGKGQLFPVSLVLSSALTRSVSVQYTVVGGTATSDQDFRPASGTVTFRPRETRKAIPLEILHDTLFEGDESILIELTSASGAFLGEKTRHRVMIVDNDPKPPPVDPGSTVATALEIDLATLPRQSYQQFLSRTDVDTFMVELAGNERLALDVDPTGLGGPLPNSKLTVRDEAGTLLTTVGASAEPEGGRVTNNAAQLFQADADGGKYFIQLTTTGAARSYPYSLAFHRIGVSEKVPDPELLNVAGPMYAWFDGDRTVGITGPTGYGFTLVASEGTDWQQQVTATPRSALRSQTLSLNVGSQFTLRSPQGVELPLIAIGAISIKTKPQRWGDVVGVVNSDAIKLPAAIDIGPVNNLLAEAFGSQFATAGLLSGEWRISLGGTAFNVVSGFGAGFDRTEPIDQLQAGVPYLRKFGQSVVDATVGGFSVSQFSQPKPMNWVFDPADPMLYIRIPSGPGLAVSKHGLLRFVPQDPPDGAIDAGVTEFSGHVYGNAPIPLPGVPVSLGAESAIVSLSLGADFVINVDADRDGKPLGNLRDIEDLSQVISGDFSEVREILRDIQLGANGTLSMSVPVGSKLLESVLKIELGQSSQVLNGPAQTLWTRGEHQGKAFPGTPLEIVGSESIVMEGLIDFGGDFFFAQTVTSSAHGLQLSHRYTISNEGVTATITGDVEWSATIDYQAGTISGKAKASFMAQIAVEIDDDGDVHLAGSITASGKLTAKIAGNSTTLFSGSIEASVRSRGFRFKFPRGVGSLDLDVFV